MASGHRSFGRSSKHSARPAAPPPSTDATDGEEPAEEGSIDEHSASGRRSFGRSSRLSAQPVADPDGPEANDSDDTPDEGSVAENAASLLSISVRRRRIT